MLRVKISKNRRSGKNQRLEFMDLDIGEKVCISDFRLPCLLNECGFFAASKTLFHCLPVAWKTRRQRVEINECCQHIRSPNVACGKLVNNVLTD